MEKQNRQPELTLLFTVLLTGIGGRAGGNGPTDLLIGFGCAWSTLCWRVVDPSSLTFVPVGQRL